MSRRTKKVHCIIIIGFLFLLCAINWFPFGVAYAYRLKPPSKDFRDVWFSVGEGKVSFAYHLYANSTKNGQLWVDSSPIQHWTFQRGFNELGYGTASHRTYYKWTWISWCQNYEHEKHDAAPGFDSYEVDYTQAYYSIPLVWLAVIPVLILFVLFWRLWPEPPTNTHFEVLPHDASQAPADNPSRRGT